LNEDLLMCTSRWFTLLVLGIAATLIPWEALLAQGKRPPFPPGLHDRTLPPGRPFDGGGFDPPGRGRGAGLSEDEARELDGYLSDPIFAASHALSDAVAAFNRWVEALPVAQLETPPDAFSRAFFLLREHLGLGAPGEANATPATHQGSVVRSSVMGEIVTRNGTAPEGNGQDLAALRSRYLLPMPAEMAGEDRRWMLPGMAAATPTGFGAEWGLAWAAASYQPKVRYNDGDDGAVAIGFGLGDAQRWVGLQVGINSFSTVNSGFGNRVGVDVHLHRSFGGVYGVAVGWESVRGSWDVTRDSGENAYVVGSRWLQLRADPHAPFGVGMVSLGVGGGRFQTESAFYDRKGGVGVFGSFGVRVAPPVTLIAEWTGQDLMLATSVTPLRYQRVAITAGFTEITGAAGDGARFVVGGSAGYDFVNR
jgi:hypothetical protein